MNFLSNDFSHLSQNDENYKENFEDSFPAFERYTVLFHTLCYLNHIKTKMDGLPPNSKGINTHHLKNLRPIDTSTHLSQLIS